MPRRALIAAFVVAAVALPALASNDPFFPEQWALARMQAEEAWSRSRGAGVVIAVIDTGADPGHPDLAGKVVSSFDCRAGSLDAQGGCTAGGVDDHGHGTWVSGIAAAVAGNGQGIAGVAPDAGIMSIKALGADGSGDSRDVVRAIRWAVDNGARIVNLSLGPESNLIGAVLGLLGADQLAELRSAFDYAASKGALVVAAAGNDGLQTAYSGIRNVFVVGATGPDDEVAAYSSSGAEIYAPGGNDSPRCPNLAKKCVATTDRVNDGDSTVYRAVQGSSFAAPQVSGVAALLMAQGLGAGDVVARINQTADPVSGVRRVNAARAVSAGPAVAPPLPAPAAPPPARPGQTKTPRPPATAAPPAPAPSPPPSPLPEASPSPLPEETPAAVVQDFVPSPSPAPVLAVQADRELSADKVALRAAASGLLAALVALQGGYVLVRRRRLRAIR